MKLLTFHTYRGQAAKDTTQSRRTFTTRLEVMPESTSYLQELSVQASSCPVTPSPLPPALPAQSERGSGAGRAGGRKPSPWRCLQEGCQPVTQAAALTAPAGRAPGGRREGGQGAGAGGKERRSPTPPAGGRFAGRVGSRAAAPRAHTAPEHSGDTGGTPARQVPRGRGGRAAGQRSLLARPDKEAPNPAREGGKRGARGDKPEPPAPTAPPERLHLSPATVEGRKRRGGGCAPDGKSAASSSCGSSRGTATAARSPALLSRPPARAGPPRPSRRRPPMAPPAPKIDGHDDQS